MKKFYKIEDFLDTTSSAFALKGTSPLTSGAEEVTMCTSANVLAEIEDSFAERSIYVKETETPMASFAAMWARWLSRRGDRLAASWEALHTRYKPLDNYDRYEEGTDTHAISPAETTVTTTPAETTLTTTPAEVTNTITPAETTNTNTPAATTNTNSIVSPGTVTSTENTFHAFNSSDAVATTGQTVTDTGSTTDALTIDASGTDVYTVQSAGTEITTVQTSGTEATTTQQAGTEVTTVQTAGSDSITYGKHTYGNIGVTSAMDMLRQELEIDTKDFVYNAICEFINLYTVYA